MSQESAEVIKKIEEMHATLDEITYYGVLDLNAELGQNAINDQARSQFQKLVMEWHVDRYSSYDLGDAHEKLQEIFSFINTAHQVVTDEDRRAEYDMELSGENTDVGAILNAESSFRRGQNMLEAGSYKGAHEQFRSACESNPEELEYRAHFLYTEFLTLPKNEKSGMPTDKARGRDIYKEMDEILAEMPERDWLLTYLGVVAKGLNNTREAQALFYEALTINPRNVVAKRQQRLMKMRSGQKKGFFAQLKEKIGLT